MRPTLSTVVVFVAVAAAWLIASAGLHYVWAILSDIWLFSESMALARIADAVAIPDYFMQKPVAERILWRLGPTAVSTEFLDPTYREFVVHQARYVGVTLPILALNAAFWGLIAACGWELHRRHRRTTRLVAAIFAVHLSLSLGFLWACGKGVLEVITPVPFFTPASAVTCPVAILLRMPVGVLIPGGDPFGWMQTAANSFLWALVLYWLYRLSPLGSTDSDSTSSADC